MYELTEIPLEWLSSDELYAVAMYPATPHEIRMASISIIYRREISE